MPLIQVKNLTIGYDQKAVIQNLNFKVEEGDFLCVVGENGAGKSTLIKTLLNLKEPMSGKVILDENLKPNEMGYLSQQTSIQKEFPASVFEVVLSGYLNQCGLRPFFLKRERKGALENLKRLGIEELKNCCYRELSGGQQQRVLLARALCATQKVLLLDEPEAGLDPVATAELYELTKTLNKELNITIIMISHDIKAIKNVATHVLHLNKEMNFYGSYRAYSESEVGKQFLGGRTND